MAVRSYHYAELLNFADGHFTIMIKIFASTVRIPLNQTHAKFGGNVLQTLLGN